MAQDRSVDRLLVDLKLGITAENRYGDELPEGGQLSMKYHLKVKSLGRLGDFFLKLEELIKEYQ